jgi:nucleotide-binding universal stress UspA family protein
MENKSIRPVDSDTIMVPTDFTEAAENALKHALNLAKIFSKKVDLLHVVADGRSASAEEDKALARMKDIAEKFSEACELERAKYKVVLLDEYQDTSQSQVRMLSALFGSGHPVMVVGDPCQAIYTLDSVPICF